MTNLGIADEKFVSDFDNVLLEEGNDVDDEYRHVSSKGETYIADKLTLESGIILEQVPVRFNTFGSLNSARDNCMVVCHALTGNADLESWWGNMLGENKLFDTTKVFIVCANILGSCYGTCGPTSINPETGQVYGIDFPYVTVRDSVSLHMKLVREHLLVKKVACVVGGSLGGMQALEWAIIGGPDFVGSVIAMCCNTCHHPWQISISESQRQAIYTDLAWRDGMYLKENTRPPLQGIAVARSIAMTSYRSHFGYDRKFGRRLSMKSDRSSAINRSPSFEVQNYLRYQGRKFSKRFDAISYVVITKMMDSHDVGRGRDGGVKGVLSNLKQPVLVISVDLDALYPPSEQRHLSSLLPNAHFFEIESEHGHDAFLLEQDQIVKRTVAFMKKHVYLCMSSL